jgi:hypothetical protein
MISSISSLCWTWNSSDAPRLPWQSFIHFPLNFYCFLRMSIDECISIDSQNSYGINTTWIPSDLDRITKIVLRTIGMVCVFVWTIKWCNCIVYLPRPISGWRGLPDHPAWWRTSLSIPINLDPDSNVTDESDLHSEKQDCWSGPLLQWEDLTDQIEWSGWIQNMVGWMQLRREGSEGSEGGIEWGRGENRKNDGIE